MIGDLELTDRCDLPLLNDVQASGSPLSVNAAQFWPFEFSVSCRWGESIIELSVTRRIAFRLICGDFQQTTDNCDLGLLACRI